MGGGGGGVGVWWCTEFCTFMCSPKAAVPCRNKISWNTIPELNNFFSPFENTDIFLILLTWWAMLKFISISLNWYGVNHTNSL